MPVYETHIHEVIENPSVFGLTGEYVRETYRKYNEPLGVERNARHEIHTELFKKGWIRIRRHIKPKHYEIELHEITDNIKVYLRSWSAGLIEGATDKISTEKETVKIIVRAVGDGVKSFSLKDFADGSF